MKLISSLLLIIFWALITQLFELSSTVVTLQALFLYVYVWYFHLGLMDEIASLTKQV